MLRFCTCLLALAGFVTSGLSQSLASREAELLMDYQDLVKSDPTGMPLATSASRLGRLYQDLGRVEDAEWYYLRALRTVETSNDPALVLAVINCLASLYLESGDLAKAERLNLNDWLQSATGLSATRAMSNFASLEAARGRFENAEPLFLRAILLYEQEGRLLDVAGDLNNLAVMSIARGKIPEGIARLERSLAILDSQPDAPGMMQLRTIVNSGVAYSLAGRREDARRSLDRAVALSEEVMGAGAPARAQILSGCAAAMQRAGYKSEAKALRKQADAIQRTSGPARSASIVSVADLMPRAQGRLR